MTKTEIKLALKRLDLDETINKLSNLRTVFAAMEVIKIDDDDPKIREEYLSSWPSIVKEYLEDLEKISKEHFQVVNFLSNGIDEVFD